MSQITLKIVSTRLSFPITFNVLTQETIKDAYFRFLENYEDLGLETFCFASYESEYYEPLNLYKTFEEENIRDNGTITLIKREVLVCIKDVSQSQFLIFEQQSPSSGQLKWRLCGAPTNGITESLQIAKNTFTAYTTISHSLLRWMAKPYKLWNVNQNSPHRGDKCMEVFYAEFDFSLTNIEDCVSHSSYYHSDKSINPENNGSDTKKVPNITNCGFTYKNDAGRWEVTPLMQKDLPYSQDFAPLFRAMTINPLDYFLVLTTVPFESKPNLQLTFPYGDISTKSPPMEKMYSERTITIATGYPKVEVRVVPLINAAPDFPTDITSLIPFSQDLYTMFVTAQAAKKSIRDRDASTLTSKAMKERTCVYFLSPSSDLSRTNLNLMPRIWHNGTNYMFANKKTSPEIILFYGDTPCLSSDAHKINSFRVQLPLHGHEWAIFVTLNASLCLMSPEYLNELADNDLVPPINCPFETCSDDASKAKFRYLIACLRHYYYDKSLNIVEKLMVDAPLDVRNLLRTIFIIPNHKEEISKVTEILYKQLYHVDSPFSDLKRYIEKHESLSDLSPAVVGTSIKTINYDNLSGDKQNISKEGQQILFWDMYFGIENVYDFV